MPKITKSTNKEKRMNKKNKKEKYILKKLMNSDVYQNETRIGKYDKESFVILDSTETIEELNKICKTKNFNKTLKILGVKDCGFADEYDTCDRCGKIIHTYNSSYTEHLFLDCTIICCDCFSVEDMDGFINNHKKSIPNFFFENIKKELVKDGWVNKGEFTYQMGGSCPDPEKIMDSYKDIDKFFVTTGFNMFGCDFELWVKEVENDE